MTKNRRRIPAPQPEPPAALVQEEAVPESEPQAAPQTETETEKDSDNPEKPSLSQKIASLIAGLPAQKAKRITGFLCLTVSILLFLAMLSHFFYWWMDYDVVQQMQKGSIWSDNGWQVRNFGGRLGAYIPYALVNQGFGLASFFPFPGRHPYPRHPPNPLATHHPANAVRTPLDIHFSGKPLQRGEQLHLRG